MSQFDFDDDPFSSVGVINSKPSNHNNKNNNNIKPNTNNNFKPFNDNNQNYKENKKYALNNQNNIKNPFNTQIEEDSELKGFVDIDNDNNKTNTNKNKKLNSNKNKDNNANNISNEFEYSKDDNDNDYDEAPLLEELGISVDRIKRKIFSVLTIHKMDKQILDDADMAGPFMIFILFAICLILQKKTHFGYIYGITLFGGYLLCTLMNLMSRKESILLYNTISVLGYCMIPVVIVSFFGIFISLKQVVGSLISIVGVFLSSYTATIFFEEVLALQSQKWLVFYPVYLFYACFMVLTLY